MQACVSAGLVLALVVLSPVAVPAQLEGLRELYRKGEELYQAGRLGEAEPGIKEALEQAQREIGPQHPRVVSSLDILAPVYRAQGRYAEAEPLFRRALAIREKDLGSEHPAVALNL